MSDLFIALHRGRAIGLCRNPFRHPDKAQMGIEEFSVKTCARRISSACALACPVLVGSMAARLRVQFIQAAHIDVDIVPGLGVCLFEGKQAGNAGLAEFTIIERFFRQAVCAGPRSLSDLKAGPSHA